MIFRNSYPTSKKAQCEYYTKLTWAKRSGFNAKDDSVITTVLWVKTLSDKMASKKKYIDV
jgi:hypothetical protein